MSINRRNFLKTISATSFGLASAPSFLIASTTTAPHIVVLGGGFSGATVAKYIKLWSNHNIKVTLIDPKAKHTSCIMSNLVLTSQISLDQLEMSYDSLSSKYGVNIVKDTALEIDHNKKSVKLNTNGWLSYDKLIIATGIGFENIPGHDYQKVPHAWIAGQQTSILKNQLNGLEAGGTFVMSIPKAPYRCPPGPYERACLVAAMLKRKGGGQVIILDANDSIQAEKHTFSSAFGGTYKNIIDYRPGTNIESVNSDHRIAETEVDAIQANVLNIIPNQRAINLLIENGLTDNQNWAPVDPITYESLIPEFSGVYVIGDTQATGQPKSGHIANSQAKICADAVIRSLYKLDTHHQERVENITTNSACYSPITYDEASWLTANFAYDQSTSAMELVHIGEAKNWNKENYKQMYTWASNLFNDSFF